jgi:hypothetical protein
VTPRAGRATLLAVAATLAAAVYSWFAGGVRAFSAPAGALTGIPYAVVAPLAWLAWRRRRDGATTGGEADDHVGGRQAARGRFGPMLAAAPDASVASSDGRRTGGAGGGSGRVRVGRRYSAWIAATALVVCWELVTYFSGPRRRYPTGSSLFDAIAHDHPARALVFFAWLLLGWALVGR